MASFSGWVSENRKTIFWWAILLILIYFPLFMDLGDLAMRTFDESRLANNAYNMTQDHDWICTHYSGHFEMWGTKPPLFIWAQAWCIKLMGASELAIRLPAALCATITCIMIMVFSQKFLKSFWTGFVSVLVLITAHGYVGIHGVRTGDYDSMVTMFILFYFLSFFIYTQTHKNKYLVFTFIGLTLAVLTKGIAGCFFLPAMFFYGLSKKEIFPILRNKWFYIGLIGFLIPALGYYFLREQTNPGYMKQVWYNELGGRYLTVLEMHKEIFWFYINNLIDSRFSYWMLLVFPGIALGLFSKDKRIKNLTFYLTLGAVLFLFTISYAETKLFWYDIPAYPLFALIIGNMFKEIYNFMRTYKESNPMAFTIIKYVGIIPMFIYPYTSIMRSSYKPTEANEDEATFYRIEYYMQQAERGQKNLDKYTLCFKGYEAAELYYIDILNGIGQHVKWVKYVDFKPGENVIVSEPETEDSLKLKYNYQLIDSDHTVKAYHILDVRKK